MLTVMNLHKMLTELLSLKEIGCTYDFKERFEVALSPLEVLDLVKVIRTKTPACGDHCERYNDCLWIPIFQKRKSKSKHKLTKDGLSLLENLSAVNLTEAEIQTTITDYLINSRIVDHISSLLIGESDLTKERLVTSLLKETNLSLQDIRTTIKDILDLLVSAQLIGIKEGTIVKYV